MNLSLNSNKISTFPQETAPASHLSPTVMEKLTILAAAAKYDVACTSSGVDRHGDGTGIGNTKSADASHYLKFCLQMNVFLTVPTAKTAVTMIYHAQPLPLRKFVRSPLNFTAEIISKDCFLAPA